MRSAEVLIIGAGPTGLVLALWLTKIGVKVRIIDKAERAGTTSRALILHARNLEFYRQLGIAETALKRGIEIKGVDLWAKGKRTGRVQFSMIKANISPYQYMLGLPQDEQEEMLEKQLAAIGIEVERNTELISFEQTPKGIIAQIRKFSGENEQCHATYLAGCDGAHSTVREQMKVGFPGGTYEETYYVADLKCKGLFTPGEINIALDDADFLAIFPLKGSDATRLVGTIRESAKNKEQLKWEDVSEGIIKRLKMDVEKVKWFSTYKVHHRVAAHFREGNVFLLGDAGHIHSPVGGQGMNTGIGDAVNLAWKIGAVIKDSAPKSILDTYEPERIAFARKLVSTTDKAFEFVSARGPFATWVRINIIPYLLPWLFGFAAVRRALFRTVSQTAINYRKSALSIGGKGKIRNGDRLPWVKMPNGTDNFAVLTTMQWQIHVYGNPQIPVQQLCEARAISLHVFPWSTTARQAGLKKSYIYVIRPDGYIGTVNNQTEAIKIVAYFDKWGIGKMRDNK